MKHIHSKSVKNLLAYALVGLGAVGCSSTAMPSGTTAVSQPAQNASVFMQQSPTYGAALAGLENRSAQKTFNVNVESQYVPVRLGQKLTFSLQSGKAVYAHLYIFQKSGKTYAMMENVKLPANTPKNYPGDFARYVLKARPPVGSNGVLLIGTEFPMPGLVKNDGSTMLRPVQLKGNSLSVVSELQSKLNRFTPTQWDSSLFEVTVTK